MATFQMYGRITFSSSTNASNAYNAMNSVLGDFPTVVEDTTTSNPAGLVRSSSVVTLAFIAPDRETAEAFAAAMRTSGWSAYTKSSFFVSVNRMGA